MKRPRKTFHDDLAWGTHAVRAILQVRPESVLELYLQPEGASAVLEELAVAAGVMVQHATSSELDKRCGSSAHQGVLVRHRPPADLNEQQLYELVGGGDDDDLALLLVLDGVTDAHNLGACIRVAEALGAHAIVMPRSNSASLTPAARKAASGAAEYLPLARVGNLARVLRTLQDEHGVCVVGLDERGDVALPRVDLSVPCALVLGSEGGGMRRLTRECCDLLAGIPVHGNTPSLNVGMACAVSLYEVCRQRASVA